MGKKDFNHGKGPQNSSPPVKSPNFSLARAILRKSQPLPRAGGISRKIVR
jgi:hypothetical protein